MVLFGQRRPDEKGGKRPDTKRYGLCGRTRQFSCHISPKWRWKYFMISLEMKSRDRPRGLTVNGANMGGDDLDS